VVTLTDLAIPRTNSINVTAIAKDDVTLTSAELTTTDDGPSLDIVAKLIHSCNEQSLGAEA
jgi:hypothetical protein